MKSRNRKALLAASAVVASVMSASATRAASVTWDGGGSDDFTATAANWVGDVTPAPLDALIFAGATRTTPSNNIAAGTIFKGVTFDATASGFTLSGNQIGLAHLAGVANSSAVGQTASLPLNLGFGTHVISGGSGGLAVNGAVTRDVGAVAKFSGTVSSTSLTNDSTGIIGGWATVGSDWASVSGGNVVAYSGYTDTGTNPTIVSAPGANLRWIQTTTGFTSALGTGTIDINSLKFGDSNQNATLTFTASTTLRFGANGGFFRSAPAFAGALNFGASTGGDGVGFITAGGADNTPGDLVFNIPINGASVRPVIKDNGTGVVRLIYVGETGTLQLNAASTYTGGTWMTGGILRSNHPNGFGTGDIHVAVGGNLYLDEFTIGTGVERIYPNDIWIEGDGNTSQGAISSGALRIGRTNVGTSGTIHLLGDSRIQFRGSTGVGGLIKGRITGTGNLKLGGGGLGTSVGVLYSTANDWTGNTSIDQGIIKLANSEVLPNGTGKGNIDFIFTSGTLDLNGATETINGLTMGANELDIHKIRNSAATAATLIVGDNNANGSVGPGGTLENGVGTLNLAKTGSGTLTVDSPTITYTGGTTVNGGTLLFARSHRSSSSLSVANGAKFQLGARTDTGVRTLQVGTLTIAPTGTVDLGDNDLVVDNGSFTDIQAKVLSGFGNPTGGITSSTSNGSQILALFDNALVGAGTWNGGSIGANAVVGKYTYFGDANIDGQVTGDDYTVIDANLNTTPAVGLGWLSGDMNLDGSITGDDYTVIDANLGLGVGNPLSPSALVAVPEPAGVAACGFAIGLLTRRRRAKLA